MTQWIDDPEGGRERGAVALARAWYEAVVHPFRFFRTGIAPGDQAPGLVFAMAVVLVEEVTRLALLSGYGFVDGPLVAVLWLGVAVLVLTPLTLHVSAAVATVVLIPLVEERATVSETVQVVAYAGAPCVLAAVPVLHVRALAVVYGAVLLVVGTAVAHRTTLGRAALAAAVPAALVFAYGFRGIEAVGTLLRRWYII